MNWKSIFQIGSKGSTHPLAEVHQNFMQAAPVAKTSISELSFLVLDTETSGLDIKKDSILSISAIPVQPYRMDIGNRFEAYFHRGGYQPGQEIEVHGILSKHLQEAPKEEMVLEAFIHSLGSRIVVGHHIGFDQAIINEAVKRHFGFKLRNRTLDTSSLYRRLHNPFRRPIHEKPYSLDELCSIYKIPLGARHTAAGDAYITSILFMKILAQLEERGVKTLKELMRI